MKKLTPRQEAFAQDYITLGVLADAYRKNYRVNKMTGKMVALEACRKAQLPHVAARIAELMEARCKRTGIDADYVLRRLVEIDEMDVLDILNENGAVKPIAEWPPVWRSFISGMDVTEISNGDATAGLMKKIKWPDKVRNLELIGKHVNVQAWKERVEHSGNVAIEGMSDGDLDSRISELINKR